MPFYPISQIKISPSNLIFVSSKNLVFIINKDLQYKSEEKGLIFTLRTDQPCLDFFILD